MILITWISGGDFSGWRVPAAPRRCGFDYIYRWDRQGCKGRRCRLVARGSMNSALLEFLDGYRMVTSRNALMKWNR
jgi:hypothetical protein